MSYVEVNKGLFHARSGIHYLDGDGNISAGLDSFPYREQATDACNIYAARERETPSIIHLKFDGRYCIPVKGGFLNSKGQIQPNQSKFAGLKHAQRILTKFNGESEMSNENLSDEKAIELFQKFQLVSVKFHEGEKSYVYKAPHDMQIAKDDYLVVNVSGEFKVVQVNGLQENLKLNCGTDHFKWICAKVDLSPYFEMKDKEEKLKGIMARAREARERKMRVEDLQSYMSEDDLKSFQAIVSSANLLPKQ